MQRARKPPKWYASFDKWSTRLMIALFAIGILFVIADAVLLAGIFMQNRGVSLSWLFGPQPTPIAEPAIYISPAAGEPGTSIAVNGKGWKANDPLIVQLEGPSNAGCPAEVLATVKAAQDGTFGASFVYPPEGCWSGLSHVLVVARSLETEKKASAEFRVLAIAQTPTPTSVVEPTATPTSVVEPTATPTSLVKPTATCTPIVLWPTATPTAQPTATATAQPTATAVPTATPTRVVWPTATATPTPTKVTTYPDWKGEYWPNLSLSGNPTLVRNDAVLVFDWGQGSPGGAIPSDNFSARWTRTTDFEAATYRFHALIDDGIRLWVNDQLIMDAWSDHNSQELTTDYVLAKGTYTLKVEYYERIGNARIQVWWEKVSPSYADWKGEYWPNRDLSGNVTLVRNDKTLDFDWGANAPASGLPTDNFSVRWTRKSSFDAATYRFHVISDDGVRLWVDGRLLIDAWQDQQPSERTVDWAMLDEKVDLKVEYYEHTGGARIKVWWEKVFPSYSDWKGEYWPNRSLSEDMRLVRNDRGPNGALGVNFDWGSGAPATGLPTDDFSARWTRQMTFEAGVYRLYAEADDGVRVYVDGQLVIDEWHSYQDKVYQADVSLNGTHELKVEFYEKSGKAWVDFWWKRTGDLSTPTPTPKVEFSSAMYTVDEGAGTATIAVILSPAYDQTVTVDYVASGGTAIAGSDYTAASGTLTFSPGVTSRTFTVGIIDDALDEADETVVLVLSNPVSAQLGTAYQATLTIVDNDVPLPLPQVSLSNATYSVDEGAGAATITVLLSAAYDQTVTVNYATTGGTADVGSDYSAVNGTLTFEPGVTSRTFVVNIVDDAQDEENETVVLALSNPVNATLGATSQATLIIVDNDVLLPPPQVSFSSATYSVDEGTETAVIPVILSAAYDKTVMVDYATAGGTADQGSDYSAAYGTLTFEPGVTSQAFAIAIVDDERDEEEETVVLTLADAKNATLGAIYQATLVIVDNDTIVPSELQVSFSDAAYSADEGAGTATITVTLSAAHDQMVTVGYATTGGTADEGSDYAHLRRDAIYDGTLTFEPGVTSQALTIAIVDDAEREENEMIELTLADPENATLGPISRATLVIVDNDGMAPSVLRSRP